MAQSKGYFEVYDFDSFKLHVYYTNDVLGDASYIIEGANALVTMEQPLFKENVTEFDSYLSKLKKPVEQRITNYHVGGTGNHAHAMMNGMPEFSKGKIYGGMMQHFQQMFEDKITELPTGDIAEIAFNKTYTWAGVTFTFSHGASTDFPAASIVIGNKIYYTHWTPSKSHINSLQVYSLASIDAEIEEAKKSLNSGAELFIGGHGGATRRDTVKFKVDYLTKMKKLATQYTTSQSFENAMKEAYPNLPGENQLKELSLKLYPSNQ